MTWEVVPNLLEGRDQLNARFPNRDKTSEGTIGDLAHQVERSSHNPDKTGLPEWADGDALDEVRAWDVDKDLNDPSGITMEDVVQLWLRKVRAGEMKWIRYFIYNHRIWHRSDNFTERPYTGSNPHEDHCHLNSDFNEWADEVTGTNWFLNELGAKPAPAPAPLYLHLGSEGDAVSHLQDFYRRVFPLYREYVPVKRGQLISVDGDFGPQTEAWVKEFQRRCGITVDGIVGPLTFRWLRNFGYKY